MAKPIDRRVEPYSGDRHDVEFGEHYRNVRFGAVAEYMIASASSSSDHVIDSGTRCQ